VATLEQLSEADVVAVSAAAGEPDWLRDRRQEAFKAFTDLDWPHRRVEEWRYTDPARYRLGDELVASVGETAAPERGIVSAVGGSAAAGIRLVDSGVAESWVGEQAAADGVVATDLATAAHRHPDLVAESLGATVGSDEKFDAANLAAFTAGAFVRIPTEVAVAEPITVTVQAEADGMHVPRVLVSLGAFAKANVYIDHAGGAEATLVEVVEVSVGEGAHANVVTCQDWSGSVDVIATHRGRVGENAEYHHLEATLGGGTVYIRPDVELSGVGAFGELLGVYFASERQHFEHRSLIHHAASHTTSESLYKGALQGESRTTWFGNIRIEPEAKATTSDETNRNLILSDGAKADTLPFLEIATADVTSCGHHSSVGQLDELQLFYLQSRGIPFEEATRLLVFGFFADVMERIDLQGVTDVVLGEIESEIAAGATALMDPRRAGAEAGDEEEYSSATPADKLPGRSGEAKEE
jgi:Fe-S cluster assembly protein SufD